MSEKNKGLYHKYDVFKAGTNQRVSDCIVLKFDDPIAENAIRAWALSMRANGYSQVADDVEAVLEGTK